MVGVAKQSGLGHAAVWQREGFACARLDRARWRCGQPPLLRSCEPGRLVGRHIAGEGRRVAGQVLIDRGFEPLQLKQGDVAGLKPGTRNTAHQAGRALRKRRKGGLSPGFVVAFALLRSGGVSARRGRRPVQPVEVSLVAPDRAGERAELLRVVVGMPMRYMPGGARSVVIAQRRAARDRKPVACLLPQG